MTLGKRLRDAREAAGLSQEKVGAHFGISRAAVAQWESDGTSPEAARFIQIADLYGVGIDWLLSGRGEMREPEPAAYGMPAGDSPPRRRAMFSRGGNVEPAPELRTVPLISWVQAGRTEPVSDPDAVGGSEKVTHTTRRVGPNAYALRVRGDSMEPRFHDGDIIIVDPALDARNGSFVVVRFDDAAEATFKQLAVDAGKRYLKPLNPRYPIVELDKHATLCGTWVQTIIDG